MEQSLFYLYSSITNFLISSPESKLKLKILSLRIFYVSSSYDFNILCILFQIDDLPALGIENGSINITLDVNLPNYYLYFPS